MPLEPSLKRWLPPEAGASSGPGTALSAGGGKNGQKLKAYDGLCWSDMHLVAKA